MFPDLVLLPNGAFVPVQLLILSLALACVACLAWILVASPTKNAVWYSLALKKGASRAGLNAAEKGTSSVAIRAEHIPYDLEKRAILHRYQAFFLVGRNEAKLALRRTQRWMMIAHASHFPKPGDYRTYTVASIPLLVIRGPDGILRAFHNVCRHRAYTVARKPCGSSLRLACKYHGWQYDAAGRLVKAPQFADKPGFDLAANGLFRIHLRIDSGRFVFVNLATELADAFPWTDLSSPALKALDFGQKGMVEWEVELDVGWRVATLLPWFLDRARFVNHSWPKKALTYLYSSNGLHLQYVDDASFICDLGAGDFLLISALPLTGHKSIAKCTYLPSTVASAALDANLNANNNNNKNKSIMVEDLVRAELGAAVASLQRHRMATTALDFQQSAVRERLDKFSRHVHQHRRAETLAGRKLNPALRRPTPAAGSGFGSRPTTTIRGTTTANKNKNYPIGSAGEHLSTATTAGSSQQQQQQQEQQQSDVNNVGAVVDGDAAAADLEAEAIGNILDGLGDGATTSGWCPLLAGERSSELEW
ncbi:hypothetical protein PG993_015101 [Apiospora rasikravindrae]|uniref:Rieske domain-containing protein n=1 Tax=Apiospora rasikravindrae TaxID=990691 RepID=A0ABR1RPZ9_9PEZI